MKNKIFTSLIMALAFTSVNASVVINELMPKNVSYQVDDQYQFSGWAELYNNGAEDVDISLYFFSDSITEPNKWQLTGGDSEIILKAGEYKVFYFDETERPEEDEEDEVEEIPFHANFKLPAKKGSLYLANETGAIIDQIAYDTTYRNTSYGRIKDGGEQLGYFSKPTPNASNAEASVVSVKTQAPQFNLKSGFYTTDQEVTITASDSKAKIYYTTNGSEPTQESTLYEGPITISKNTPLRAISYVDGELVSDITTASYFINETVNKLPIVSLVTDNEYVFGDDLGILVVGKNGNEVPSYCSPAGGESYANYMNGWDRPSNFELFDSEKNIQLNQEVKIGNFGACSRTKYIKSIKVNAGKVYGSNKLDYSIFKEKPNLKWKSIVLRNGGNDYGRSYLRDAFIQTLLIGQADIDHQAYQPSMVFINGEFYGMLNIRERTNKDFIYSNYGLDEGEFYINEGNWANESESGYSELEKMASLSDMNAEGTYEYFDERIDINEFLNYFMAEMYCGNQDWPGGNIKCWKAKGNRHNCTGTNCTDGKWRWILYDTEYSYSLYSNTVNTDCFTYAIKHKLFKGLIKNNHIKERLLGKLCVHLATTYAPTRVEYVLDSLLNNIQPDVQRYIDKISDARRIEQDFDTDIKNMRTFANKRIPIMYKNINKKFSVDTLPIRIYSDVKEATFSINEEPIRMSDFNGYFFTKTYCNIVADEPAGYVFDHWEIMKPGATEAEILREISYADTFTGGTFKAVYVEDKDFDPSIPQIFINEICATNSVYVDESRDTEDWIELFNYSNEAFDLGGLYLSNDEKNLAKYKIPTSDSTIIGGKQYLVFWADNDTEQGVLHTNFKLPATGNNSLILSSVKVENGDSIFTIIDSVQYKTHRENDSYARFGSYTKSGKQWKITGKTTLGQKNIYGIILETPVVSMDDNSVTIAPNPVEDELYFSLPIEGAFDVTITTVDGRAIRNFTIRSGKSVQLADLTKGLYILTIQTDSKTLSAKLIKK